MVGELGLGSHCTEKDPHDLPVKKAERKRVVNPHYESFERDSTPYGKNVGVSEVDVFD